jgi:sec-independent protein translocase protein TatB
MARHFRSGIDAMIRESELEEMEKKWREENERILREHPFAAPLADPAALEAPAEVPPAEVPPAEAPPAEAPPADVPPAEHRAAPAPPKPDELP